MVPFSLLCLTCTQLDSGIGGGGLSYWIGRVCNRYRHHYCGVTPAGAAPLLSLYPSSLSRLRCTYLPTLLSLCCRKVSVVFVSTVVSSCHCSTIRVRPSGLLRQRLSSVALFSLVCRVLSLVSVPFSPPNGREQDRSVSPAALAAARTPMPLASHRSG